VGSVRALALQLIRAGGFLRKNCPVVPTICARVGIVAGGEQHAIDLPPPGFGVVAPMRISTVAEVLDVQMGAVRRPERRQVFVQDDWRALIVGISVLVLRQDKGGSLIAESLDVPDTPERLDNLALRPRNRNVIAPQIQCHWQVDRINQRHGTKDIEVLLSRNLHRQNLNYSVGPGERGVVYEFGGLTKPLCGPQVWTQTAKNGTELDGPDEPARGGKGL
jgi:hypothetical protein